MNKICSKRKILQDCHQVLLYMVNTHSLSENSAK